MKRPRSNTCIAVCANKKGRLFMAADRRISWDFSQATSMNQPKIAKRDGLLLGATGDGSLCTQLVNVMNIPENTRGLEPEGYIHEIFFVAVKKLLDRKGYSDEHKVLRIPPETGVELVIGIEGRLFSMLIENQDPMSEHHSGLITIDELPVPYATGCGGQWAWSSLKTSAKLGLTNPKAM